MVQSQEPEFRLDFGNLPLMEAAVRATLDPPLRLTYDLITGLASAVAEEFPELGELDALESPPGLPGQVPMTVPQLPGAKYAGNSSGIVMTLQDRLVAVRWNRRAFDVGPEYPRFPVLESALWNALDAIQKLCQSSEPSIMIVNMVYVNFIQCEENTPVLREYFADEVQIDAVQSADPLHELMISWREEDGVDVRLHLQAATARVGGEERKGYRLSTAAGMRLDSSADPNPALRRVHNQLQVFFERLLSDRAKREWKLKVVADDQLRRGDA